MKKLLSVILCVIMLFSVMAVAANAYEIPATPEVIGFENCVATWTAVDGADGYRVQLYVWNYDADKIDNWTWVKEGAPVFVTEGTQADLKDLAKAGNYTFTVAAYQEKELTEGGKIFRLFGEASAFPVLFDEADPMITKVDPTYPWADANGDLDIGTDVLPEGEVRGILGFFKQIFEILKNFYEYLMSFAGVRDLVK